MKLPIDQIELPFNVVLAIVSSTGALLLAGWQFVGSMLAQMPTPDQVSGWQERDIYLCALILFGAAIVWMARWIATKLFSLIREILEVLKKNTDSNASVANALKVFTDKVDSLVVPAVTHAMSEAFSPAHPSVRREEPKEKT